MIDRYSGAGQSATAIVFGIGNAAYSLGSKKPSREEMRAHIIEVTGDEFEDTARDRAKEYPVIRFSSSLL